MDIESRKKRLVNERKSFDKKEAKESHHQRATFMVVEKQATIRMLVGKTVQEKRRKRAPHQVESKEWVLVVGIRQVKGHHRKSDHQAVRVQRGGHQTMAVVGPRSGPRDRRRRSVHLNQMKWFNVIGTINDVN